MAAEGAGVARRVAARLHAVGGVKFGEFRLKSGLRTPVYLDLRVIVSYPDLMETISNLIYDFAIKETACDHLCGVPYTALPLATLLSVRSRKPMLMRRKEAKAYGTKKMIEGHYEKGQSCLIIEDVITSGSSIMETVGDLRKEGLIASEAIVLVDREQGGRAALEEHGVRTRSLFTLTELVSILAEDGKIEKHLVDTVKEYLRETQAPSKSEVVDRTKLTFEERSKLAQNPVTKQLFHIMATKQTNLCVSVDLTSCSEILNLLETVGGHVCLVKTHIDIIEDFTDDFISQLKDLAQRHNFLIMEDRKYADIGNTVALQYAKGLYRVAEWADLVTCHSLPGAGVLKGISSAVGGRGPRGVFLLAEMSSENNLITPEYTASTVSMASAHPELISGLVCQNRETLTDPGLIQLTPGVQLDANGDGLGQSYNSPETVVLRNGADIAVVGRGIVASKHPETQALRYKEALWDSYMKRILIE